MGARVPLDSAEEAHTKEASVGAVKAQGRAWEPMALLCPVNCQESFLGLPEGIKWKQILEIPRQEIPQATWQVAKASRAHITRAATHLE